MLQEKAIESRSEFSTKPSRKLSHKTIQLSDEVIKNCLIPKKRTIYRFIGFRGFGLRVSPLGIKTWVYLYAFDGTSRMLTLGRYPGLNVDHAFKKYLSAKDQYERGIDPSQEYIKRNATLTVSELIDRYEEFSQKTGKRDWKAECHKLRKDLLPTLRNKKVHLVTCDDLRRIFDNILFERSAPSTATHLFSYTRRLFNYAGDIRANRMRRRDNPCQDIRLGIKHKSRTRHLTTREIYKFWKGVDYMDAIGSVKSALKFMLCTVARGGEVRNMMWSDLSMTEGVWTVQETKNGHLHRIHIKPLAHDILLSLNGQINSSGYVFKSCRKSSLAGQRLAQGSLSQTIRRNFDQFDIDVPFTPHDLRRTAATIIAAMTGKRASVKRALNHVDSDITSIYDQYAYDKEKSAALSALDFALNRIISSPFLEAVPSLEQIRNEYDQIRQNRLDQRAIPIGTQLDSATTSLSPVSYKLSYGLVA